MTKIRELGNKDANEVKDRYANLPAILAKFETELDEAETHLKLDGKRLDLANQENPAWQHYYDQRRVELGTLAKYMEAQVQRTRGRLFKNISDQDRRDLSDRAKDKFIDSELAYLNIYELYLEVSEMYEKYKAVVDAFTVRGYALNNITKLRVASLENIVL